MVEMEKKERMKKDAIRQRDKNHPGSINNRHILILYLFILFYFILFVGLFGFWNIKTNELFD